MSLKYAENAVIKGFVGVPDQFAIYGQNNTFTDAPTATPQQIIDEIFSMSNDCRDGSTIFADEQAFHPVSQGLTAQAVLLDSPSGSAQAGTSAEAPAPPMKKLENNLATALLIGAGVFVLYKILS
jgi:hypothetical protein